MTDHDIIYLPTASPYAAKGGLPTLDELLADGRAVSRRECGETDTVLANAPSCHYSNECASWVVYA